MQRPIAIGFVLYRPGPQLLARMEMLLRRGLKTYVFDNSPSDGAVREFCRTRGDCHYWTCGKNLGLGLGISAVCAQAYHDSHEALLFFDQDTAFSEATLDFIEDFHANNAALSARYSAVVFEGRDGGDREEPSRAPELRDELLAISSGSLFFLENLRQLGWHNTRYFVDCVDYEFCLRSSNGGFRVGVCSGTPGFDHVSEQADRTYRLFGRDWRMRRYPPRRVIDALTASLRLMGACVVSGNVRMLGAVARSLAIYAGFQVLVRLLPKKEDGGRVKE